MAAYDMIDDHCHLTAVKYPNMMEVSFEMVTAR